MEKRGLEALLCGAWKIVKTVVAGEVQAREEGDEHFLWFLEDSVVTGNRWAAWHMPYELKSDCLPMKINVTREDFREPFIDKGLVAISNQEMKLCMAGEDGRLRPRDFTSTPGNGHTLYIGARSDEPLPE